MYCNPLLNLLVVVYRKKEEKNLSDTPTWCRVEAEKNPARQASGEKKRKGKSFVTVLQTMSENACSVKRKN